MKKLLAISFFILILVSCQTQVVTPQKPIRSNSLDLYTTYNIQTNDARTMKVKVLKQDDTKIYGKLKSGENVVIEKKDVREVKKFNVVSSVFVALAAVAAVILIPI